MLQHLSQIHPLLAIGVVASTAATDAVYVFFTASVSGRRTNFRGDLEQRLVSALLVRGDYLHARLDVCALRGGGIVDRRLFLDDATPRAGAKRAGAGCTPVRVASPYS